MGSSPTHLFKLKKENKNRKGNYMKKQQILSRMMKIVNKGKPKKERLDKQQLENVLEAFKQTILECVQKGEDFSYRGLIDIETTVVQPRERKNPRTQETVVKEKGYRVNAKLAYSIKQIIKQIKVK